MNIELTTKEAKMLDKILGMAWSQMEGGQTSGFDKEIKLCERIADDIRGKVGKK